MTSKIRGIRSENGQFTLTDRRGKNKTWRKSDIDARGLDKVLDEIAEEAGAEKETFTITLDGNGNFKDTKFNILEG